MKLSDKRQAALYSAISGPIMDERVRIRSSMLSDANRSALDDNLFRLEQEIWRRVKAALDLEGA